MQRDDEASLRANQGIQIEQPARHERLMDESLRGKHDKLNKELLMNTQVNDYKDGRDLDQPETYSFDFYNDFDDDFDDSDLS